MRVLDAGTGSGALAQAFAKASPYSNEIDLLDLSPAMLAIAEQNVPGRTRAIHGALGTDEVAEATYDRVLCGHTIEHCANPNGTLAWLFTRLKPGGMLILAVSHPHWCPALVRWKYGSAAFYPKEVTWMLSPLGFEAISVCPHDTGPPSRVSCGYLGKRPQTP